MLKEKVKTYGLGAYHSALEIRDFSKHNTVNKNRAELRGAVKIAVIDDEKFKAFNNLKSYGYDISELSDISRVSDVASFEIILCDLMGVGRSFDQSVGGASLIKEIKTNYPTKFVIAYTGARANSVEAIAAKEHCDHFLKKDADMTEWTEMLDGYVDIVIDPYEMWLAARQGLFEQELDIRDVLKLEDAYVQSVLGKDAKFEKLADQIGKMDISGNARGIVQSLIASAIYSLILA